MATRFGELNKRTKRKIRKLPGFAGLTKKQARGEFNKAAGFGFFKPPSTDNTRFGELSKKKKDSILSANKNEGLTRQQVRDKYNQRKVNRNALKLAGSMFGPMVGPVPPEVVDETTDEKGGTTPIKLGEHPETPTTPGNTPDFEGIIASQQQAINDLMAKLNQPVEAPTVNVNMPEPEESLGRAKAAGTYVSGGSAGGIRRRRSNRSKLGFSGLGTNQLNRNVSNLLSIRGINI